MIEPPARSLGQGKVHLRPEYPLPNRPPRGGGNRGSPAHDGKGVDARDGVAQGRVTRSDCLREQPAGPDHPSNLQALSLTGLCVASLISAECDVAVVTYPSRHQGHTTKGLPNGAAPL